MFVELDIVVVICSPPTQVRGNIKVDAQRGAISNETSDRPVRMSCSIHVREY